jgi:hypothetical protein
MVPKNHEWSSFFTIFYVLEIFKKNVCTKFISSWVKNLCFVGFFLHIFSYLQFMVILLAKTINEENEKMKK